MAQQRRDDQYYRCVGKERFVTHAMAQRVATLSMQRREGVRREAYRCKDCGGFHVGSTLRRATDDFKRGRFNLDDL